MGQVKENNSSSASSRNEADRKPVDQVRLKHATRTLMSAVTAIVALFGQTPSGVLHHPLGQFVNLDQRHARRRTQARDLRGVGTGLQGDEQRGVF
jgi:hypothetical protein